MMLANLLAALPPAAVSCDVVSMLPPGAMAERITALGIPVSTLNMRPGLPSPAAWLRLVQHLRRIKPTLLHTWLYHADLLGSLAAPLAGVPVVWGLHNSTLSAQHTRRSTRMVVWLLARLSGLSPRRIVSCSQSARQVHIAAGYAASKFTVIPNGFDLERFTPNPSARTELRAELNLPADTPLIGMVARFDPLKDHANFIQAAGLLHQRQAQVHYILAGSGCTADNPQLTAWAAKAGISGCLHLLGRRSDTPHLLAALDVCALSSFGEAFPMVVGEAMACGVPCAVTDVGDSALLVGATGRVVPPGQPAALADALFELLTLNKEQRATLSQAARAHIQSNFSLPEIAAQYLAVYQALTPHPFREGVGG